MLATSFPDRIIKIGMRHGPYHFKRMTSAANYNLFDVYMFSSQDDLAEAIKTGVKTGVATGYPKLDPAINSEYSQSELDSIKTKAGITPEKPILLFSATWPGSGMSGLDLWKEQIGSLKDEYNLMVTLHPWVSDADRELIRRQGIYIIKSDVIKHIYISDIVIGDTSSLLAEACALDKPMLTWKTPWAKRSHEKIQHLIESFSLQVETIEDLKNAIERYLANPTLLSDERQQASELMFDKLDGLAGKRAANEIIKLLPELTL
jgi:CDP-glycerol glycerophosphotransferase (TagB/SpsB family)